MGTCEGTVGVHGSVRAERAAMREQLGPSQDSTGLSGHEGTAWGRGAVRAERRAVRGQRAAMGGDGTGPWSREGTVWVYARAAWGRVRGQGGSMGL